MRRAFQRRENEFAGDYATWADAQRLCSGYGDETIIEVTRRALLKVKRGEAVYERDSVLFDHIEYSYPVLANLLYVATLFDNRLRVLDFGGSLGSSYFQNRGYLGHLRDFRWGIVEQPPYVSIGLREFEDDRLRFFTTARDCIALMSPNVLLLSGVVQYLEDPLQFLRGAVEWHIPFIIIDRALLVKDARSRLTIQTVPPSIYRARYPCWILREAEFLEPLVGQYELRDTFDAHHGTVAQLDDAVATYRGFFLEKRERPMAEETR